MFYPADPAALRRDVEGYLSTAPPPPGPAPRIVIVPHAGFVYSGPIAATAYATLRAARNRVQRVVLIGPSHRVWFKGLALPQADAFETPLGRIAVDAAARESLRSVPGVVISDRPHESEHSLEVQLPFLQSVLGEFRLLPIAVGDAAPAVVADVLGRVWGGAETLIVVSTDLSHYHPYAEARRRDERTSRRILALDGRLTGEEACGCVAVNGLLHLARGRGLRAEQLDLRNSGDTAGDRSQVVGYAAFAFHETDSAVT
jgi:AmmeMemoRadiSam system protein B